MARCAVCDKGAHFGIKVSHSHRRSNKMWKSNIKSVRVKAANGGVQKMYVCTSCLKSGKVERTANNKAQVKSDEKDVSETPEKNKDSKVVVEINDAEENGNATGNSASCTAYADGSVTYYVDGKQVDLTKDELEKLEKNGKVTINVNLKNAKQK